MRDAGERVRNSVANVQSAIIEGAALTVLEGEVADQSALVGVFNVLHTMSLPVMAVERRGWDNSGQPTKNL